MEEPAMVCAKAIATKIPIAMPVSSVSREINSRVFPGVREVVKEGGITASIKST
jgi:hypothetical protein